MSGDAAPGASPGCVLHEPAPDAAGCGAAVDPEQEQQRDVAR